MEEAAILLVMARTIPECPGVDRSMLVKCVSWRGKKWQDDILSGTVLQKMHLPDNWMWFWDLARACQTDSESSCADLLHSALGSAVEPDHRAYLLSCLVELSVKTNREIEPLLLAAIINALSEQQQYAFTDGIRAEMLMRYLVANNADEQLIAVLHCCCNHVLCGRCSVEETPSLVVSILRSLCDDDARGLLLRARASILIGAFELLVDVMSMLFRIGDEALIWFPMFRDDEYTTSVYGGLIAAHKAEYQMPTRARFCPVGFSDCIRRTIVHAMREAYASEWTRITSLHFVLGVLAAEGKAFHAVVSAGLDPDAQVTYLREVVRSREYRLHCGNGSVVLETAVAAALSDSAMTVDSLHLLAAAVKTDRRDFLPTEMVRLWSN